MRKPSRVRVTWAPRARRHSAVASMSWEVVSQSMSQVSGESAAQMRRRCASDLEAGALTVPSRRAGVMVTFKRYSLMPQPSSTMRASSSRETLRTTTSSAPRATTTFMESPWRFLSCVMYDMRV